MTDRNLKVFVIVFFILLFAVISLGGYFLIKNGTFTFGLDKEKLSASLDRSVFSENSNPTVNGTKSSATETSEKISLSPIVLVSKSRSYDGTIKLKGYANIEGTKSVFIKFSIIPVNFFTGGRSISKYFDEIKADGATKYYIVMMTPRLADSEKLIQNMCESDTTCSNKIKELAGKLKDNYVSVKENIENAGDSTYDIDNHAIIIAFNTVDSL